MSKGKILFKLTGSIACYKACAVISRLVQNGFEVQTVATKSALEFVGAATLEGLSGRPVLTDTFAPGQYMQHIQLAKWADLVVLCPATANTINSLASGAGDTLVGALFLAHDFKKPYLVAPAMNTAMYQHPATKSAIKKLRKWGVRVLDTGSGALACGDVGEGRLLEPELLVKEIETFLPPTTPSHLPKVLITSGGTKEPLDGVRSLTNFSTGRTGAFLADYLSRQGFPVTLLRATGSSTPEVPVRQLTFESFSELNQKLKRILENESFDAVVHLAAVSDFSIESIESKGQRRRAKKSGKLDSEDNLTLHLTKNFKIVDRIKHYSKKQKPLLIAFKLTHGATARAATLAVKKLAAHSSADYVVQNDVTGIDSSNGKHKAQIFHDGKAIAKSYDKTELAQQIETIIIGQGGRP